MTPSISAVNLLLFIAIAGAVCSKFKFSRLQSYGLAFLASCGATVLYLDANIFLSQLISMWLWANIVLLIAKLRNISEPKEFRNIFILIGINFAATFFTYPHMAIIGLGCYTVGILTWNIKKKEVGKRKKVKPSSQIPHWTGLLIPFLIIGLTCNYYLKPGINLFIYRASASNGWPMPHGFSLANILLVGDYSGKFQNLFEVWSIIFILLGLIIGFRLLIKNRQNFGDVAELLLWVGLPLLLYGTLALLYGPSSYKAWKVIFSFTPLLIAGLLSYFILKFRFRKLVSYGLFFLILLPLVGIPMMRQSIPLVENQNLYPARISSADLYSLETDLKKFKLRDLNVKLNPFFESMYAAAIVPSDSVHLAVPSYAPILTSNETCTLVRKDGLIGETKHQNQISVNETYALLETPAKCLTYAP